MGCKTLCDMEAPKVKALLKLRAKGLSNSAACALAGIKERTLYGWKERGDEGEEPYATFVEAYYAAGAKCERALLAAVDKAAFNEDWRAAAWRLERLNRAAYSDKQIIEHGGGVGVNVVAVPVFGPDDPVGGGGDGDAT